MALIKGINPYISNSDYHADKEWLSSSKLKLLFSDTEKFKKEVLESISEFFDIKDEIDFSSYKATEPILEKIKKEFEINEDIDIHLSQKLASFLWEKFGTSVSFESKNIIYYGAPLILDFKPSTNP